jgi:serine protease AprX
MKKRFTIGFATLLLLLTTILQVACTVPNSIQVDYHVNNLPMERNNELLIKHSESIEQATTTALSDNWFRDKNQNKIDDLIENQEGSLNIFIHYNQRPTTSDVATLSTYAGISNVYQCINVIAANKVPKTTIETITKLPNVVMVEWQGFTKLTLDISVPATKARQSSEYSPNTAWDLGYTGNGVTIAIVDSGVDNGHESFTGKFIAGYDATTGTTGDPDDTDGHGTHVAGTAMGTGGPSQTYRGVAPNARLVDVKVMGGGTGSTADLIEGIDWVVNNRATFNIRIMSISIAVTDQNGNEIPSDGTDAVSQAVNNAVNAGLVVTAAVGNSGQNIIPAPAAADRAVTVGAVYDLGTIIRDDDILASFSNFGPRLNDGDADSIDELKPDIVAPGDFITAPQFNTADQYWSMSGTSMATPHVAGVIALMLEKEPNLTPAQVKDILHKSADDRNGTFNPALDPKYDVNYGWGIVDAYEAVEVSAILWERVIISTHFSAYYNITGPNTTTDEYAQAVSNALEKSWMTIVINFGFNSPPEAHITVYLEDLPSPILGKTSSNYNPLTGWHVEFIKIDVGLEQGLARVTATHEFFHTVQLSYDPTEADWISEGTAKWAESRVYPEYTGSVSYVEYVNSYMNDPDRSLPQLSYEAVLFWIFIDQHYGISTLKTILQQTVSRNGINAVNAALNTIGTSFVEVFKEWTIANYFKDIYYSNGQLFNPITLTQLTYSGGRIDFARDVIDWGADYYVVTSSVIYMPMQFIGGSHHNLTKVLIEHGELLISDFLLFIPYAGSYWLMQANNLDKIVIIVRSLGTETSNDRTAYTLTWLSSSQTLNGPYTITSAISNIYARNEKGTQASSSTTAYIIGSSSSQSSPQVSPTVLDDSSYKSSSTKQLYAINSFSQQNSATLQLCALNDTSSQSSSTKSTTVTNDSSTIGSSPTPIEVNPIPPTASFIYRPPSPVVNQTVTLDATNSTPNGGIIINYQWDFGDTSYGSGRIVTHVYSSVGNYTVTLNVTDSEGLWSTSSKLVTINESGTLSIDIKNIAITDQNGNPKARFIKGDVVQFNFTIENAGNLDLERGLISLMILDPTNTPIFLSYTFENLNGDASKEFIIGYRIPFDVTTGNYTGKIMVFTDWPSHGGVGLDIEIRTFEVTS